MMRIILTVGPPACGKTTWAENYIKEHPEFVNVNRDDIRYALFGRYYNVNEIEVTSRQKERVIKVLQSGKSVIISDTNLNDAFIYVWENIAKEFGIELEYKHFFGVSLADLLERNKNRERVVPERVIRDMYTRWREKYFEPYNRLPALDKAFVFDIDGTLAINNGRNPFDWSKVGEDGLDHHVSLVLCSLHSSGYKIVMLSGRDSICRGATKDWLHDNRVPFHYLFMRPHNNYEKDSIVKYDLFKQHVELHYNVIGVFDDRKQVIDMWRKIGLTVFDVAGNTF